jgi:hypothetical protein
VLAASPCASPRTGAGAHEDPTETEALERQVEQASEQLPAALAGRAAAALRAALRASGAARALAARVGGTSDVAAALLRRLPGTRQPRAPVAPESVALLLLLLLWRWWWLSAARRGAGRSSSSRVRRGALARPRGAASGARGCARRRPASGLRARRRAETARCCGGARRPRRAARCCGGALPWGQPRASRRSRAPRAARRSTAAARARRRSSSEGAPPRPAAATPEAEPASEPLEVGEGHGGRRHPSTLNPKPQASRGWGSTAPAGPPRKCGQKPSLSATHLRLL